jgi:integrase
MASISTTKSNGTRAIDYLAADGSRKKLRLGKIALRDAEAIMRQVVEIVNSKTRGDALPRTTLEFFRWLDKQPKLKKRFAAHGLIAPPASEDSEPETLGPFLASYIAERDDVAERTSSVYKQVQRNLVDYFKPQRQLASVTAADADNFRRWLARNEKLAENTIRRRCGVARQFFRHAMRQKLLAENPFGEMKNITVGGNKAREFFVTPATIAAVLDACPDAEWRLIFALARYGGLRVSSEPLALTWADVDWVRGRVRIDSPKTGEREIPIFPELRPYLEDSFRLAGDAAIDDPTTPIIRRHHVDRSNLKTNANWRTTAAKIIQRAKVKVWPKIFQNMRASRETELVKQGFPLHVVCAWIGNSVKVAQKHYLQVTDADWEAAQKASQKASQYTAAKGRTVVYEDEAALENPRELAAIGPENSVQKYARQDSNLRPTD